MNGKGFECLLQQVGFLALLWHDAILRGQDIDGGIRVSRAHSSFDVVQHNRWLVAEGLHKAFDVLLLVVALNMQGAKVGTIEVFQKGFWPKLVVSVTLCVGVHPEAFWILGALSKLLQILLMLPPDFLP